MPRCQTDPNITCAYNYLHRQLWCPWMTVLYHQPRNYLGCHITNHAFAGESVAQAPHKLRAHIGRGKYPPEESGRTEYGYTSALFLTPLRAKLKFNSRYPDPQRLPP